MSSSEERLHVLKMIQGGNITAEEGVKLLETLERQGEASNAPDRSSIKSSNTVARWMRIIITDLNTNKEKINIRLPANVVDAGYKMGAKFSPDLNGVDANLILRALQAGETGKIIDICQDNQCERIEINLEP
jgi:hypothetical protein